MRSRMVRKTTETESTYKITGYMLTEKAKKALRNAGIKTDDVTWSEIFKGFDVVYRFNPDKNKQDVFVGDIQQILYASGKVRGTRAANFSLSDLRTLFTTVVPESKQPVLHTMVVNRERVSHRMR